MRKYAVLDDNIIVEVLDLDQSDYVKEASYHQLIIDIQDLIVQPQVGWVLSGNSLVPAPGHELSVKELIKARIKLYQELAPELLRDLYAQNVLLGITVEQSNSLFSEYQDVLCRIREGAWPTALYCLSQKQPSGFVTQNMLDSWSALITSRLIP